MLGYAQLPKMVLLDTYLGEVNMNVKCGADPELFVCDMKSGKIIPIIGKLGGTKHEPLKLAIDGFGLQEDNCAAEFNIPAAMSAEAFSDSIAYAMAAIKNKMVGHGLDLAKGVASTSFDPDEICHLPEAWVFGCEPDFNAYTGQKNPKPHSDDPFLRSAGGHVHVGFADNPRKRETQNVMRAMDLFVGVQSVLLDPDTRRRELYGKAGAFRYKPYGGEYRTLSNYWIFDPKTTKAVFNNTQKAVAWAKTNLITPASELAGRVIHIINTGDKDEAQMLINDMPQIAFDGV